MNKRASMTGWSWIVFFFFYLVAFVFVIGLTDIVEVEIFEPVSDIVQNLTGEQAGTSSEYYQNQQSAWNTITSVTLPYNLILIFLTGLVFIASVVDVAKEKKRGIYNVILGTVGGTLFLIYIIHLFIIGMIDYFEVQILGQLFGDLINNQIPFYNTIFEVWGQFVLFWAIAMGVSNRMFGKDDNEGVNF